MLLISYFDWFGDLEELKKWDKAIKKACEETDGIEYKGRWVPNTKYHFCWMYIADGHGKLREAWAKTGLVRDRSVFTHAETTHFRGPIDE